MSKKKEGPEIAKAPGDLLDVRAGTLRDPGILPSTEAPQGPY